MESCIIILHSVTTPNINSLLALPYNKPLVRSREEFTTEWLCKKDYVRKASGKGGAYHENKEKRRSEVFPWPGGDIPIAEVSSDEEDAGQQSSFGDCPPSEESLGVRIEKLEMQLKDANSYITELGGVIDDLEVKIGQRNYEIENLRNINSNLQERLRHYEGSSDMEEGSRGKVNVLNNTGRPLKPWRELKNRQKRSLTQSAFDEVKKTAEARDVGTEVVVGRSIAKVKKHY